jgi:catechol 2,3-dioxygenase-like lactoylglutathione lyase family enzyme
MRKFPVVSCQFKEAGDGRTSSDSLNPSTKLRVHSQPSRGMNWKLLTGNCLLLSALFLVPVVLAGQQPPVGFHHVHLSSLDPTKAIDWYTKTFPVTSRATVAGFEGITSERIHLLFTKVTAPPITALDSAIWHSGWGSPDMPADFAMHQANGVQFATPLSKLAQGTVFAYMNGPDGALWRSIRPRAGPSCTSTS